MARRETLYRCVEREAAHRGLPNWQLWLLVLPLITSSSRALPVSHPDRVPGGSFRPFKEWLADFNNFMIHHPDPTWGKRYLEMILVSPVAFRTWCNNVVATRHGPKPGANNFVERDLQIFDRIRGMIASGKARSPFGAAKEIDRIDPTALAGDGSRESKCKRVARRYLRMVGEMRH